MSSKIDEFGDMFIGAVANDKRQIIEPQIMHLVDRRAVGGDDLDRAVLLPQRIGLASAIGITSRSGKSLLTLASLNSGSFSRRWRIAAASMNKSELCGVTPAAAKISLIRQFARAGDRHS